MTTSSEILLKIVRGGETKKRVAFRGRGADVRRLGHNSFFGGAYGSPRYLTMRRTSRAEYHFEVFL